MKPKFKIKDKVVCVKNNRPECEGIGKICRIHQYPDKSYSYFVMFLHNKYNKTTYNPTISLFENQIKLADYYDDFQERIKERMT